MKILTHPDPSLMVPVPRISISIPSVVIHHMMRVIDDTEALGLAANQIGYPYRVIIVQGKVMVNPIIISGVKPVVVVESCLSLPGEEFCIKRSNDIILSWQSLDMETTYEGGFTGAFARIAQHEIDHLDGILINDIHDAGLKP